MNQAPKAFMSYSHDCNEHINWVLHLSKQLRSSGIDVILDQWDANFGSDLAMFIELHMTESDLVFIVCTDNYNRKADAGKGGVGYEKMIATRDLMIDSQDERFIPIIRQYSGEYKMPRFLGNRKYVDLSNDSKFENEFKKLVRQLHGEPHPDRPPIGQILNDMKSNPKRSDATLRALKGKLSEEYLFDFNIQYSFSYANTLNRLILDANEYKNLNIIFDRKVDYIYESNPLVLFSPSVRLHCSIYELVYKYLNNNRRLPNMEYAEGLSTIIQKANWDETIDYLRKFNELLGIFEDLMISNQNIVEYDFPEGRYDKHALVIVRDKRRKCVNLLDSI